jgi:DNA repair protein RadC
VAGRIADLPRGEPPRERLREVGPAALADRELLGILLRTGRSGQSALDLARKLLEQHGSLHALARLMPEELANTPGIGPSKAVGLVAAFDLARRLLAPPEPWPAIRRPSQIADLVLVLPRLSGLRREEVIVIALDSGSRVLRVIPISAGSIDRALLPKRETLHAVLAVDGTRFALAHNHPSGDPSPSAQDLTLTRELRQAARTVGLELVDHVIVGGRTWLSLAEAGYLTDPSDA